MRVVISQAAATIAHPHAAVGCQPGHPELEKGAMAQRTPGRWRCGRGFFGQQARHVRLFSPPRPWRWPASRAGRRGPRAHKAAMPPRQARDRQTLGRAPCRTADCIGAELEDVTLRRKTGYAEADQSAAWRSADHARPDQDSPYPNANRVGPVVVDTMPVEGQRRVTEKQHRIRSDAAAGTVRPRSLRGAAAASPGCGVSRYTMS